MQGSLFIIGIVFAVLAGISLVAAVSLFFGLKIPDLIKDMNGTLEQKQIEEIRSKNSSEAQRRGKVNVFEELEKKAKVKKNNTQSLNVGDTTSTRKGLLKSDNQGTTVLRNKVSVANPEFIIEKNIVFVSSREKI